MNADTGQIYRMPEEIAAAEQEHQELIYGRLETLQALQPLIQGNRAYRRRMARLQAKEARKQTKTTGS